MVTGSPAGFVVDWQLDEGPAEIIIDLTDRAAAAQAALQPAVPATTNSPRPSDPESVSPLTLAATRRR